MPQHHEWQRFKNSQFYPKYKGLQDPQGKTIIWPIEEEAFKIFRVITRVDQFIGCCVAAGFGCGAKCQAENVALVMNQCKQP